MASSDGACGGGVNDLTFCYAHSLLTCCHFTNTLMACIDALTWGCCGTAQSCGRRGARCAVRRGQSDMSAGHWVWHGPWPQRDDGARQRRMNTAARRLCLARNGVGSFGMKHAASPRLRFGTITHGGKQGLFGAPFFVRTSQRYPQACGSPRTWTTLSSARRPPARREAHRGHRYDWRAQG